MNVINSIITKEVFRLFSCPILFPLSFLLMMIEPAESHMAWL